MTRVRRVELLGAAVVVVLGVALAVVALTSSSAGVSHPTTSARPTAAAFGRAYLAYLGGSGAASELPEATAHVRSIAGSGGTLPVGDRDGTMRLESLKLSAVSGAPHAEAMVVGADRRLGVRADIALTYLDSRWQVTSLVPPDLDTLLSSRPRVAPVPAALRAAATRFALAYADYRERAGARPRQTESVISHQIATAGDPLAHVRPTHMKATLRTLRVLVQGSIAGAAATLSSGDHRLRFSFNLRRHGTTWRAWEFPQP